MQRVVYFHAGKNINGFEFESRSTNRNPDHRKNSVYPERPEECTFSCQVAPCDYENIAFFLDSKIVADFLFFFNKRVSQLLGFKETVVLNFREYIIRIVECKIGQTDKSINCSDGTDPFFYLLGIKCMPFFKAAGMLYFPKENGIKEGAHEKI